MIDHDGVEWLPTREAAQRVPGVKAATIRKWVERGKVAAHLIGGSQWVRMPDVWDAEHATRGRFVAQRGGRVSH